VNVTPGGTYSNHWALKDETENGDVTVFGGLNQRFSSASPTIPLAFGSCFQDQWLNFFLLQNFFQSQIFLAFCKFIDI
jgi:hypothetical protein